MFQLATAPQSIGEVLDSTFKLYKHIFGALLGLNIVYAVVAQVPNLLMSFDSQLTGTMTIVGLISFIPVMIVSLILYPTLLYKTNALAVNDSTAAEQSLRVGVRKALPMLAISLLYMIAAMLGLVLLVIPGIILMVSLFMAIPLSVIDDDGIFASLKRSHRLVWGNWWRVAIIFTVVMILYMVPYFLVGGISGFMFAMSGPSDGSLLSLMFNGLLAIVQIVFIPLLLAASVTVLNDLKARKEGVDLEARLAEA